MLLLTTTTDLLQLVTGSALSTDIVTSYVDITSTGVSPGSSEVNVSTAATTTIVSAPAASTQRQVKMISVRNNSSTTAQTVTIQKSSSSTAYNLTGGITLQAGETLYYQDMYGFSVRDANGQIKQTINSINEALTATYVGYGNASNVMTGTSDFTWTDSSHTLTIGAAGTSATITSPASSSPNAGGYIALSITGAANSYGSGSFGANVNITGGAGTNGSGGGGVTISGGSSSGSGGIINITGGTSGTVNVAGGSGSLTSTAGGYLNLSAGPAVSSGTGGNVAIYAGTSVSGTGGSIQLYTGNTTNTLAMSIASTGSVIIAAPSISTFTALQSTGPAGNTAASFYGSSTTGSSDGVYIKAGTNSSDYALSISNQAGTAPFMFIFGDGSGQIGPNNTNKLGWTANGSYIIAAPASATFSALQTTGPAGNTAATFFGSTTTGSSDGVFIQAGTNTSDYSFAIANSGNSAQYMKIYGDGSGQLGPNATHTLAWNSSGAYVIGAPTAGSTLTIYGGASAAQYATVIYGGNNSSNPSLYLQGGYTGAGYPALIINDQNNTNGASIQMFGNGSTGVYLSANNGQFKIINSAFSANMMTVDQSGNATITNSLIVSGTSGGIAEGTGYYEGITSNTTFTSSATNRGDGIISAPSTASSGSAYTLPNVNCFQAQFSTKGTNATINTLCGFRADGSLGYIAGTGATYMHGFDSNLTAATNVYNFYAGGTAQNYFAGITTVGGGLTGSYSAPQLNMYSTQYGLGVDAAGNVFMKNTNNGVYQLYNNTGSVYASFSTVNGGTLYLSALGTGAVYSSSGTLTNTAPSDARLKNNIEDTVYGLDAIMKLRPVTFNWNYDPKNENRKQFGFIAQEVQEVMPDAIPTFEQDGETYLGLEKDAIYGALVKAVQEQQQQIEEQQEQINALVAMLETLMSK